jgi:hypothetical protein
MVGDDAISQRKSQGHYLLFLFFRIARAQKGRKRLQKGIFGGGPAIFRAASPALILPLKKAPTQGSARRARSALPGLQ